MLYIWQTILHLLKLKHKHTTMTPALPRQVTAALREGRWELARHGKHLIFQRTILGTKQTLTVGATPKANGHGGGHRMLSKMRQLDEEAALLAISIMPTTPPPKRRKARQNNRTCREEFVRGQNRRHGSS